MGKKGRPLGSGNKKDVILGIRVSKEEYNIIKEGLAKLKGKYKTNKNILKSLMKFLKQMKMLNMNKY